LFIVYSGVPDPLICDGFDCGDRFDGCELVNCGICTGIDICDANLCIPNTPGTTGTGTGGPLFFKRFFEKKKK